MKFARVQLIVAAALFVGWLGYLGYLALGHSQPIVVSHSQLMNATPTPESPATTGSWVVAEVELDQSGKPQRTVHIKHFYAGDPIPEESIIVSNLPEARIPPNKPVPGKGLYLLALTATKNHLDYRIASTRWGGADEPSPLIYPWTAEVESQVKQLAPPAK